MTHPEAGYTPTPEELAELVSGVRDLADQVKNLANQQAASERDIDAVEKAARKDRRRTAIVACTVVVDLVLSLLVWRVAERQSCLLDRSRALAGPAYTMFTALGTVFDDLDPKAQAEHPVTRSHIEADFHAVRLATDAYLAAAATHPPKCGLLP